MAEQDIPENKLAGWKQIADFLGVSERTARGYEKSLNLPVHRLGGLDKSRVWAYPPELETWKGQAVVGRPNGGEAPAPDVGGAQSIPTAVPDELPVVSALAPQAAIQPAETLPGTAKTVAAAPNLWQRLNRRRWLFGVGAFGILLIGPVIYWPLDPHGPMVDFQVDGATLIGINAKRQALWQRTFPRHLMSWPYENPTRPVVTWLGDLDGDGRSNLLFTAVSSKDAGPVDDQLLCFDDHGRMKWKTPFTPGRPVRDMGGVMVPPFSIVRVLVMTSRTPDETLIVVSSIHHEDQPCQVAILDRHGRVLAEYWHPGHLGHMIQADLDGDGRNELLLGGVNNGEHRATVVVLDPWKMSGLSTPAAMTDQSFRLLDMPVANEKAVILFPRSCISVGQSYTRVARLADLKGRLEVVVAEGTVEAGPGFIYELAYSLRPISVVPTGDQVKRTHEALEAAGKLHHSYTSDKWGSLKDQVEVRWGK